MDQRQQLNTMGRAKVEWDALVAVLPPGTDVDETVRMALLERVAALTGQSVSAVEKALAAPSLPTRRALILAEAAESGIVDRPGWTATKTAAVRERLHREFRGPANPPHGVSAKYWAGSNRTDVSGAVYLAVASTFGAEVAGVVAGEVTVQSAEVAVEASDDQLQQGTIVAQFPGIQATRYRCRQQLRADRRWSLWTEWLAVGETPQEDDRDSGRGR